MIGDHAAPLRSHGDAVAVVELVLARRYEDPHASIETSARDAEREGERMEVRGVPVDIAAEVGIGTDQRARLRRVELLQVLTTVSSRELVRERMILGDVARLVRD